MNKREIAASVKKFRESLGYSQEQFCSLIDVSRQTLSSLECGRTNIINPNIFTMEEVSGAPLTEILFSLPEGRNPQAEGASLNEEQTPYGANDPALERRTSIDLKLENEALRAENTRLASENASLLEDLDFQKTENDELQRRLSSVQDKYIKLLEKNC